MADRALLKQLNFYKGHLSSWIGPLLRALARAETGKYGYVFAGLGAISRMGFNATQNL
jgi:hypothetical protein